MYLTLSVKLDQVNLSGLHLEWTRIAVCRFERSQGAGFHRFSLILDSKASAVSVEENKFSEVTRRKEMQLNVWTKKTPCGHTITFKTSSKK